MVRRKTSLLDDLQKTFFVLPWWAGPITAVATYALFRAGIPLFLTFLVQGIDVPILQGPNTAFQQIAVKVSVTTAPILTGLVVLVWLVSLMGKLDRRRLIQKTGTREDVRALTWQQFEYLVGEYYRRQGFRVEERGGPQPDGGIDLMLGKADKRVAVQCKHWKTARVGVRPVRELCGAMSDAGADAGVFVASGTFTEDARAFARKNHIKLIDGGALVAMIRSVQDGVPPASYAGPVASDRPLQSPEHKETPMCPVCHEPMVVRKARTGPYAGSSFYGCQKFPACRGIRNLPWNSIARQAPPTVSLAARKNVQ